MFLISYLSVNGGLLGISFISDAALTLTGFVLISVYCLLSLLISTKWPKIGL